jgi:hypothetical protein
MDLEALLRQPGEKRDVEHKQWLDLHMPHHQAVLAKALIALANFGGGQIVIGFKSGENGVLSVCDDEAPGNHGTVYAPEAIQGVVSRYLTHEFEVTCDYIVRPGSSMVHPIICVPSDVREVVFAKRASADGTTLARARLYTRLPGPRSDTPATADEWRNFIDGLVKRRSDDLIGLLTSLSALPEGAGGRERAGRVDDERSPKRSVRDRMSDVPAPRFSIPTGEQPLDLLEPNERFVFENPVSDAKVVALRESIRDHLDRSMPTFKLFELVGTRSRLHAYDESFVFGLTHVSFKGPFVDRSSWAEVRDHQFALAIDEYLRHQWAELLAERAQDAPPVARSVESLQRFVEDASDELHRAGGQPDLVVLLEPSEDDVNRLFMHERAWWDAPTVIRGTDVRDVTYLNGHLGQLPVLQIHGADVERPLLAIVDLSDYELLLANVGESEDHYLSLNVAALTEEEAQEWQLKSPAVAQSLYKGKHHTDGAYSTEEAVLRLQLMARYRMYAAGEIKERHRPRTISAWIEAPRGSE